MRKQLFSLALLLLAGLSLAHGQTPNDAHCSNSIDCNRTKDLKGAKSLNAVPYVLPSGDTLYFKINSDSSTVSLVAPHHGVTNYYIDWYGNHTRPSGFISIPSTVTIDSVVYTVTRIDTAALFNCHITGVSIPNTITFIGRSAFARDSLITSVYIPQSVTHIQEYAFSSNVLLDTIVVDTGNIVYDSRYNCNAIIETATNTLIKGCNTTIIPSSVTALGNYSLSYMPFTEMTIPNTIVSIGLQTFYRCEQLVSVTISESVTSIGNYAFTYDSSLTFITLQNPSLSNVSSSAFNYTTLDSVTLTVPCGRTSYYASRSPWSRCANVVERPDCGAPYYDFYATSYGNRLYYKILDSSRVMVVHPLEFDSVGNSFWTGYVQPTGRLVIPDSVVYNNVTYTVTKVGDEAFMNCFGITSLWISNSIDTIERKAFAFDFMIDEISWPISLLYMGDSALFGCGRIEITIVIPPGYSGPTPSVDAWIGGGAFGGCNFSSFTYGGSSIGYGTYSGNSFLNYFYYSGVLTTIDDHAFDGCEGLTVFTRIAGIPEVRIPRTMQSVGNAAFGHCIAITRVRYDADSCYRMGSDTLPVFMNDWNISLLTIGEHVRWIPSYAFLGCTGLDTIKSYCMVAPALGVDVFSDIPANIPVYIPCGSLESYTSRWPHFTNFIEMYDGRLTAHSSDTTRGTVTVTTQPSCRASGVVVATPRYGYHFVNWNDGDTANPRSISVPDSASVTLTANFEINEYSLTVVCDTTLGTVHGNGQYLHGATASVSIVPNYGYIFNHWAGLPQQDSPVDSTNAEVSFIMYDDVELTALFDTMHFSLTLSANNPDWGTVDGGGEYAYGTEVTITATANEGYLFSGWSDGSEENPRTIVLREDMQLTANFAEGVGIHGAEGGTVRLFPNPTNGLLSVEGEGVSLVEVYDMASRRVLAAEGAGSVDLTALPDGVYYVRVVHGRGVTVGKVVKR